MRAMTHLKSSLGDCVQPHGPGVSEGIEEGPTRQGEEEAVVVVPVGGIVLVSESESVEMLVVVVLEAVGVVVGFAVVAVVPVLLELELLGFSQPSQSVGSSP